MKRRRTFSSFILLSLLLLPFVCIMTGSGAITAAFLNHPIVSYTSCPTNYRIHHHRHHRHRHRGLFLKNQQNDFFDLKNDDSSFYYNDDEPSYNRPIIKKRQKEVVTVNTREYRNNPVENEFRTMRYEEEEEDEEEEEEYEDASSVYTSKNPNLTSKRLNRNDSSRSNHRERDTFYLDEDDIIDMDEEYEENEARLFERGGGNFWSNPKGGLDTILPKNYNMNRSKKLDNFQEQSTYPIKNRGDKTRTRVRTGTSPPSFLKDLYNRLFWYGFDPDETTTAADKTMFGGTRGKFNGLALLQNAELPESNLRTRRDIGNRQPRSSSSRSRKMEQDIIDQDMKRSKKRRQEFIESQYDDDEDEYYYEEYTLFDENSRRMYDDTTMPDIDDEITKIRDLSTETLSYEKRQASDARSSILSWNRDINSMDLENNPKKQRRSKVITDTKKIMENIIPNQSRKFTLAKNQNSVPIFGIMDRVFQIDDSEISSRAADYDRSINWSSKTIQSRDMNNSKRRRKGFVYPYKPPEIDFEDESIDSDQDTVIDVDASTNTITGEVSKDTTSSTTQSETNNRQKWIDRADADEKVPPKEVLAWGPSGLVDGGISARNHAANIANDEINQVKQELQLKKQKVLDSEEDLILAKAEASMQRKRLAQNLSEERMDRFRRRLWILNEEVEESARMLRKAKDDVKKVSSKLVALENRHWALLSQVDADKIMDKDDDI